MNFVFRVDASDKVGAGHFMRCLTLAIALKENGAQVQFLSRELPEHFHDTLKREGIKFRGLGEGRGERRFELGQIEDARETREAMDSRYWDWIVVDHYALDNRWESAVRQEGVRIMVLDDLASRTHDCDILLDPTYGETDERYRRLVSADCRCLCGSKYALLRPQFQSHRQSEDRMLPSGETAKVHCFFGSVDVGNFTFRFCNLLLGAFPEIEVRAMVGADFGHGDSLQQLGRNFGSRFHWQAGSPDMAGSMMKCDVALGAPGGTTWERACMGLPSAYLAIADNQVSILKHLEAKGLCEYIGIADQIDDDTFVKKMRDFLSDAASLRSIREVGMKAVDGQGARRAVEAIHTVK